MSKDLEIDDVLIFTEHARRGNLEGLEQMLQGGNELINQTDKTGWSALHYAAAANHVEGVRLLLEHNADPDLKDKTGNSPLHVAVTKEWIQVVLALVLGGASTSLRNDDGHDAYALSTMDAVRKALSGFDPATPRRGFVFAEEEEDSSE